MTHHNTPLGRQWKRDAAERLTEVSPWVWGLLMLTVFSAFVAVLGVGLLSGGSHAGIFVLLGGAVVVAATVAYWVEGLNDGRKPERVQTAGAPGYVPDRMGSALHRGLLGVCPADGLQTEGLGEPGPGPVVRPGGRHRVVHRMPHTTDSHRVGDPTAVHNRPARAGASQATPENEPGTLAA